MSGYRPWAVAGMLGGGVLSIAANVGHTYVPPDGAATTWAPEVGAVIGAAVWPLLLLVASEVLSRKRWSSPRVRLVGTLAVLLVAVVAAVISYGHLHQLLLHYREGALSAAIGPLAIDGLMLVCSVALVARDAEPVVARAVESSGEIPHSEPVAPELVEASPAPEPAVAQQLPTGAQDLPELGGALESDPRPVAAARLERPVTVTAAVADTRPAGRSVVALLPQVRAAIESRELDLRPTAEAIRRHLGCAPKTARALRDAVTEPA